MPDWLTTQEWDKLRLGGKTVPGIVNVSTGCGSGLDQRKARGSKRSKPKDIGTPPAKLKVRVDMNAEELDEFKREIAPMLRPQNKSAPREPLEIQHPEAALWGINVVLPGQVNSEHPKTGGRKTIDFELEEWAPEPSEVRKSKDVPKGETDDPNGNDVQAMIDALRPHRKRAAAKNLGFPSGTTPVPE